MLSSGSSCKQTAEEVNAVKFVLDKRDEQQHTLSLCAVITSTHLGKQASGAFIQLQETGRDS